MKKEFLPSRLHWETVDPLLRPILEKLMAEPLFEPFRLIGGTALSLQTGHRKSLDIRLATDAAYGSIDFREVDRYLRTKFSYVFPSFCPEAVTNGIRYTIGYNLYEALKLEVGYSADPFWFPMLEEEGIRLASLPEIAAMKLEAAEHGGSKKDFWDLHALLEFYSLNELLAFHEIRYPYSHDRNHLEKQLLNFSIADEQAGPECLHGKYWELIKPDFQEAVGK